MTENQEKRLKKAEGFIENNKIGEAMTELLAILDEDPNFAAAYNSLGVIAWQQERFIDAFGLFKAAVEHDYSNEEFLNNFLDSAIKIHKVVEFAGVFEKAAANNPDNKNITDIYEAIKSPDNDIYQTPRAYSVGYWHPLIEKGELALQNGETVEAIESFIDHIDHVFPCAQAYNGLGIVQFNAKEYDEAFNLFFESLKFNPTNKDVFLNLFDCATECGKEAVALEVYELLVKEYPDLEEIRDETEVLKSKNS